MTGLWASPCGVGVSQHGTGAPMGRVPHPSVPRETQQKLRPSRGRGLQLLSALLQEPGGSRDRARPDSRWGDKIQLLLEKVTKNV